MRFRLGMVTGFATGYYLGARAGRQRYDQINRSLAKLKRSETFEVATERARTVVEEGVGKARSIVDSRVGDGNGSGPDDTSGTAPPTDAGSTYPPGPTAGTGGYSSSR
jgi:hypothetical protein